MAVDREKPSTPEEEYFAREEIEKKRKLALKQAEELQAKQREDLRKLHHMKCPKCGMDLHTLEKGKVQVDTCFNCKGIWLDAGELEALMSAGGGGDHKLVRAVLNVFGRK